MLEKQSISRRKRLGLSPKSRRCVAQVNEAENQRKIANGKVDKLSREVQDRILSKLKEFDYNYFTKSRFTPQRRDGRNARAVQEH